jgi:hypothetical protein
VRPIPITLVTVGKGSSKGAELMAEEWADKLKRCVSQLPSACCQFNHLLSDGHTSRFLSQVR